jgi:hypothetical protein
VRRVARTQLHRDSNHSRVGEYSKHLGSIFDDWLSTVDERGYSAPALTSRLDAAAQQAFPQAFANGRHQAYGKTRPGASGVPANKILLNRHYLQNSLTPDINARVARWRLQGAPESLSDALRRSFRSRVVNGYGGAVWNVTEAGYKAGVGEARRDLAIRITGSIMAEDDEEDQPQEGDLALAVALGLTVGGLLLLVAAARDTLGIIAPPPSDAVQMVESPGVLDSVGIQVLIDYDDEGDDAVCDPCSSNAAGSPYPENECPIPGEDCVGSNNCRCQLVTTVEGP